MTVVLLGGAPVSSGTSAQDDALHLLVVPDSPPAQAALTGSSARVVARYKTFTLVEASGAEVDRLVSAGADLRDDMRKVRIGTRSVDPAAARQSLLDTKGHALRLAGTGGRGLAVVQYVGPLKDAWIRAVEKTGVQVVTYMAENGQLVSGDEAALGALAKLATRNSSIRAVVPFTAADKQLPGLRRVGQTEVVMSTVAGKAGASARAVLRRVSERLGSVNVAGIVQQRVKLDAAQLGGLARHGGVVAIEPFVQPELLDERAARIIDGALNGSFQPTLGSGHRSFLSANGLGGLSPVIIDITDEGIDKGLVPVPAGSHPDFYRSGSAANPSRIVYAQENTVDSNARDCGGHGTNVASIATGFNSGTGANFEDAQGFNYGLGIQPFGNVGATKIFNCAGQFDVTTSISALHSNAYANGARISNNSWGANVFGAYNSFSREFDFLVRDAQSGVAGNQQFTEVVSAGNAGSVANSVGAPGTAKNVITVGASESVRAIGGTDGCGVPDAGANSARDIIDFSSRGPTDDGRTKPDVVAPGTHVAGAQPQTGAEYNGSGTCNPTFPAGSTRYSLVSGTSQAAPEVTGLASLVHTWFRNTLGGGVRYPSPAMTKALLVSTASDLSGGADGAGGLNAPVPTHTQGWGRVNLGTVLNGTSRQVIDQTTVVANTGNAKTKYYNVASASQPFRVTLVWTDAPGPTVGNSFVNNLDLEVTVGGSTYKGNVFSGGVSVPGGAFDPANNVENVLLAPGATGPVKVRVIGRNIVGDGLPGNADTTDQDYALVVSNATASVSSAAVLTDLGRTVAVGGDGDGHLEPNEPFTVAQKLKNVGNATKPGFAGTMSAPASDATVTQSSSSWPSIAANANATGAPPFGATVASTLLCGQQVDLTIDAAGGSVHLPFSLQTGTPGGTTLNKASTDVPKAIPDNNPTGVVSNLSLTGNKALSDLNVTIGSLSHTYVQDLTIDLVSPAGTTVRLFNRHGGSGDNLTNTVFDDEAATAISAGAAPFSGAFRPFQPLTAFDGQPIAGTWKLRIVDNEAADIGSLNSWSSQRRVFDCL